MMYSPGLKRLTNDRPFVSSALSAAGGTSLVNTAQVVGKPAARCAPL